jgi:hypothetical protein
MHYLWTVTILLQYFIILLIYYNKVYKYNITVNYVKYGHVL